MKILVFGHIPSWAGGRQESGLANVIYQLAKNGSEVEGTSVALAATDCKVSSRKDGQLTIYGWTIKMLLGYIISKPIWALKLLLQLKSLKTQYPTKENVLGIFFKSAFLNKILTQEEPDIIHLHGASAAWYIDVIPPEMKIIVTFHGICGLDKNLAEYKMLYDMEHDVFLSRRVNKFFFISTQLLNVFKATFGENGKGNHVIFNSYDKNQFYYDEATARDEKEKAGKNSYTTLCTVASLSERKGQRRVLSALAQLPNRERFKYFCIGNSDEVYADELIKYAKEKSIDFKFLGKKTPEEIRKYLYRADYMIMPSSSEGFGLSYLEAIACGVPVILPKNIPIASENQLINKNNSILLDDSSIKSINTILEHIDLYRFDHSAVANSISSFSWDDIVRQYIAVIK